MVTKLSHVHANQKPCKWTDLIPQETQLGQLGNPRYDEGATELVVSLLFLPVQRLSWVNWCSLCTGRNRWINSELSGALIMTNEGSFLQNDQKETFVVMRSPLRKEFLFLFLLMQRENQLTPCALWTRRNRRETLSLVVPVSQRSFPVAPTSQKAAEHIKYPLLNPYLFLAKCTFTREYLLRQWRIASPSK